MKLTTKQINDMRYSMKLNDIQRFADVMKISSYDAFIYIHNNSDNYLELDERLRKLLAKYICEK